MNADGVKADGVKADGVNAEGVNADGVNADGVKADGAYSAVTLVRSAVLVGMSVLVNSWKMSLNTARS